jgi:hypothetical protein
MVGKWLRLPGVQMNGKKNSRKVSIVRMRDLVVGQVPFSYRITMIQFGIGISKSESFKKID